MKLVSLFLLGNLFLSLFVIDSKKLKTKQDIFSQVIEKRRYMGEINGIAEQEMISQDEVGNLRKLYFEQLLAFYIYQKERGFTWSNMGINDNEWRVRESYNPIKESTFQYYLKTFKNERIMQFIELFYLSEKTEKIEDVDEEIRQNALFSQVDLREEYMPQEHNFLSKPSNELKQKVPNIYEEIIRKIEINKVREYINLFSYKKNIFEFRYIILKAFATKALKTSNDRFNRYLKKVLQIDQFGISFLTPGNWKGQKLGVWEIDLPIQIDPLSFGKKINNNNIRIQGKLELTNIGSAKLTSDIDVSTRYIATNLYRSNDLILAKIQAAVVSLFSWNMQYNFGVFKKKLSELFDINFYEELTSPEQINLIKSLKDEKKNYRKTDVLVLLLDFHLRFLYRFRNDKDPLIAKYYWIKNYINNKNIYNQNLNNIIISWGVVADLKEIFWKSSKQYGNSNLNPLDLGNISKSLTGYYVRSDEDKRLRFNQFIWKLKEEIEAKTEYQYLNKQKGNVYYSLEAMIGNEAVFTMLYWQSEDQLKNWLNDITFADSKKNVKKYLQDNNANPDGAFFTKAKQIQQYLNELGETEEYFVTSIFLIENLLMGIEHYIENFSNSQTASEKLGKYFSRFFIGYQRASENYRRQFVNEVNPVFVQFRSYIQNKDNVRMISQGLYNYMIDTDDYTFVFNKLKNNNLKLYKDFFSKAFFEDDRVMRNFIPRLIKCSSEIFRNLRNIRNI